MGYKPCWHDTASGKLAVFVSRNKQVVQIRIQVSHVGAVSTLVEFAHMYDVKRLMTLTACDLCLYFSKLHYTNFGTFRFSKISSEQKYSH